MYKWFFFFDKELFSFEQYTSFFGFDCVYSHILRFIKDPLNKDKMQ